MAGLRVGCLPLAIEIDTKNRHYIILLNLRPNSCYVITMILLKEHIR